MGGFSGARVCLRVISDLHDTAAPSPGKVTPKTKGTSLLLRRERGAQSRPVQLTQWETEQGNRQGTAAASSTEPDPHAAASLRHRAAAGPEANLTARRARSVKETEQGLGTLSVAVLSLLALCPGFYTFQIV